MDRIELAREYGRQLAKAEFEKAAEDWRTNPDDLPWLSLLPFGSSYSGMARGSQVGRPGEGLLRGFAGGIVGSGIGAALGGSMHPALGLAGLAGGKMLGTHLATRGMLPTPVSNRRE